MRRPHLPRAKRSLLTRLAADTLLGSGVEPMISLTVLTPHTVYAVVSITYDRDVQGNDEQAMNTYVELSRRCAETGYYPYRLGIQATQAPAEANSYPAMLGRLKATLDPSGLLGLGRYEQPLTDRTRPLSLQQMR